MFQAVRCVVAVEPLVADTFLSARRQKPDKPARYTNSGLLVIMLLFFESVSGFC
jgi:hypothetical protein